MCHSLFFVLLLNLYISLLSLRSDSELVQILKSVFRSWNNCLYTIQPPISCVFYSPSIFSSLIHLLCVFHVAKNVGAKCKALFKENRQEYVMELWNKIMYSKRVVEYEQHLQHFELICIDIISLVDYVNQTWLSS